MNIFYKAILTSTIFCTIGYSPIHAQKNATEYIEMYKEIAILEQNRTGIPAAIKLAQGILESASGQSELAQNANAHFGIKCKNTWKGMTYTYDDDAKNECFRKYESALDSYKDHSDFLKNNKRYSVLFDLDISDYSGWAHGLKKCGYATNPKYAQKLIEVIEKHQLHEYTTLASNYFTPETNSSSVVSASVAPHKTTNIVPYKDDSLQSNEDNIQYYTLTDLNGLKGFYAKKDDLLLQYAIEHKTRYAKLISQNELEDGPLPYDMFIYIDKKRVKGLQETDVIRENENIHQFAQRHGIMLSNLLSFNHLKPGQEPEKGTVMYLQNTAPHAPSLLEKSVDIKPTNPQINTPKSNQTDYISKSEISGNTILKNNDTKQIQSHSQPQETTISFRENTTQQSQNANNLVTKKESNTEKNTSHHPTDALIDKFDQTVYINSENTKNQQVSQYFKEQTPPQQFKNEETTNIKKTSEPLKSNKPQAGNSTTGKQNFPLKKNPNELLAAHMNKVKNNPGTFVQKETGSSHTSAPVAPSPTKKVTTTKKTTSTKKPTTTKKTTTSSKKTNQKPQIKKTTTKKSTTKKK